MLSRLRPLLAVALLVGSLPAQTNAPALTLDKLIVNPSRFNLTDDPALAAATLTQRDLETRPQIGEDLFRSIARLPGIAADDYTAKFWVRNAPQRQLLVRLDGADLLEPFHLKDVDGALSIIDLHAISRLDLMTGGFGADYGNRAAGVLAMESVSPATARPAVSLGLSLTSLRAGTGGTFANGAGRYYASVRRGYPDIALKAEGRDDDIFPRYWDAYAKAEYDLNSAHTLSLHVLHATDTLRVSDDGDPELRSRYGSDTLWARWQARFSETLSAETVLTNAWLTWQRDGAGLYTNRYRLDLRDRRSLDATTLRQDWSWLAQPSVLVRGGWQVERNAADYSYRLYREDPTVVNGVLTGVPRSITLAPAPSSDDAGFFLAPRLQAGRALTLEPSVRFDRHSVTDDSDWSPRFNAAYAFNPHTTLRTAWGLYAQSQGVHELPVQFGDATFQRSEQAEHRIVSLEHVLQPGLVGRVELYERLTAHPRSYWLSRFDPYNVFPEAQPDRLLVSPQRAEARGVEFMLQSRGGARFNWSVSYALAKATETLATETLPGRRDQRHTFNADIAYTPNARWTFSAAWQYHTGWPITEPTFTLVTLANGSRTTVRSFGPTLGTQLPAYHRLDLRASRTIPLRHGTLKVFVDIFNAYNRENLLRYDYETSVSAGVLTVKRKPKALLPLLPSAGISWDL